MTRLTVILSPNLRPDRTARQCQRNGWREIQADQDSGVSETNAEPATG